MGHLGVLFPHNFGLYIKKIHQLSSELTPRVIRRKVEELLGLDSEVLDTKEYKATVKKSIEEAMVRLISILRCRVIFIQLRGIERW
jgi:hypothetical protein